MREKGQTEAAKTLETPVFSRGIEILTEKAKFTKMDATILAFGKSYIYRLCLRGRRADGPADAEG